MKLAKRLLLILIVLAAFIFSSVYIFLLYQSPTYEGVVSDLTLTEKTKVYFDSYGIPHIYAENAKDAYKVLGYVHAQDRLFQMDLMRRVGAGRLSEIFGEELIEVDRFYRTLGISRKAKEELAQMENNFESEEERIMIESYLEGVNTFIDNGVWPAEYRLLGIDPEPFEMINLFETAGYMAFSFAFTLKTEPVVNFVLENYPDSAYLVGMDIIYDSTRTYNPTFRKKDSTLAELALKIESLQNGLPIPVLQGSNSWTLAPSRSESGKVLFSNDTHIKFSQPAVWYESHIEYPGFEFYGNFLPGIPFALVGHNKKLAWGLTMFENDDADLYYETLDSNNLKYSYDGKWKDLTVIDEEIRVKGEENSKIRILETLNGPIVNEFIEAKEQTNISFWWTYQKFDNDLLNAFYLLNTANNLDEVEKAASRIHGPGLNLNYGDAEGNIAWWACAKMVKRPKGMNSMSIHDGSDPKNQLNEYWDFSDNPQSVNPPWGYVASSNNQPGMMPDSTWYPGYYAPENRAKRVKRLIESRDKWNSESLKALITDVTSIVERDVNSSLCGMILSQELNDEELGLFHWMGEWDGAHDLSDARPILYYRWIQLLLEKVYKDEFGEKYFEAFTLAHRVKRSYPIVFSDSDSPWWDNVNTDQVESPQQICTETFKEAIKISFTEWGRDYRKWSWGDAHQLYFEHALGKVDALKSSFNVGPFPAPGGNETINNAGFHLNSKERVRVASFGPQMRIIIDFADVEHSISINPTGQSGNFMSEHYDDQAKLFVSGKFRKQLMDKEIIEKGELLLFNPKK